MTSQRTVQRRNRAIQLANRGRSRQEIAHTLGVSRSTIDRYLKDTPTPAGTTPLAAPTHTTTDLPDGLVPLTPDQRDEAQRSLTDLTTIWLMQKSGISFGSHFLKPPAFRRWPEVELNRLAVRMGMQPLLRPMLPSRLRYQRHAPIDHEQLWPIGQRAEYYSRASHLTANTAAQCAIKAMLWDEEFIEDDTRSEEEHFADDFADERRGGLIVAGVEKLSQSDDTRDQCIAQIVQSVLDGTLPTYSDPATGEARSALTYGLGEHAGSFAIAISKRIVGHAAEQGHIVESTNSEGTYRFHFDCGEYQAYLAREFGIDDAEAVMSAPAE